MEVIMSKVLSRSDATNKRLEFPTGNLEAFPMAAGQNSFEFTAFDKHDKAYRLKVSVRNQGKYAKPWISGQWGSYASEKGLKEDDRVTLSVDEQENGERRYHITAERLLAMGIWLSIEEWQLLSHER